MFLIFSSEQPYWQNNRDFCFQTRCCMKKKKVSFQKLEIFLFLYFLSLDLKRAEVGVLPLKAKIKISSVAQHELPHHAAL